MFENLKNVLKRFSGRHASEGQEATEYLASEEEKATERLAFEEQNEKQVKASSMETAYDYLFSQLNGTVEHDELKSMAVGVYRTSENAEKYNIPKGISAITLVPKGRIVELVGRNAYGELLRTEWSAPDDYVFVKVLFRACVLYPEIMKRCTANERFMILMKYEQRAPVIIANAQYADSTAALVLGILDKEKFPSLAPQILEKSAAD